MMAEFNIPPLSQTLRPQLQQKIDSKTKPPGALGLLERMALQIGLIQNSLTPTLHKPTLLVFAGDHGIAAEGVVNPYPQAVTRQMVLNFLHGGAAVSLFCRQNGLRLKVIDAGVIGEFEPHSALLPAKVAAGTRNYRYEAAMTIEQSQAALNTGADIVRQIHAEGCNVVGFGEMGIGNTSSAAILMHLTTNIPLIDCVGRGTGLDETGVQRKRHILQQAIEQRQPFDPTPQTILATFGGFEIAMMCGAMLQAAALGMLLLIDGFIVTATLLIAQKMQRNVTDYCLYTHQSDEAGHRRMLTHLQATPLLNIGLRLGEGSGVAVAYPLVQSAVTFLNEMASFADAQVSQRMSG